MKKTVVGAGLSGMVAAINLAHMGYEVEVLEKMPRIGGVSKEFGEAHKQRYIFGDMTPFDAEALSGYINIDLQKQLAAAEGVSFATPLPFARMYSYGKKYDMHYPEKVHMKLIERGARKSSLDYYIYQAALEAGVKFYFDTPIADASDFHQLAPGTILATGMFISTYQALGIPHSPLYVYLANRKCSDYKGPKLIIHFDKHMKEFCEFSSINGIAGALLFQRDQHLSEKTKDWYRNDLEEKEGITFTNWHSSNEMMATPTGSISNPRLFHDKFILAGTLAGMQDPFVAFGVHGALISGRIAAIAVVNKEKALAEFNRMLKWWKLCYGIKKIMDVSHPHASEYLLKPILSLSHVYDINHLFRFITAVPGFKKI